MNATTINNLVSARKAAYEQYQRLDKLCTNVGAPAFVLPAANAPADRAASPRDAANGTPARAANGTRSRAAVGAK